MSNRTFTCIICPNGCTIRTEYESLEVRSVEGNKCKRGEEYVRQELTDPRRTISTTVPIQNAALPLCSVRLDKPVPKKDIFRVMEQINQVQLIAPVRIGQPILKNVLGLGANVIVTKNMDAME